MQLHFRTLVLTALTGLAVGGLGCSPDEKPAAAPGGALGKMDGGMDKMDGALGKMESEAKGKMGGAMEKMAPKN